MASIRREEIVQVSAEHAWAMLRDVGRPHRVFAGVLVDGSIDGDVRTVTFANGMIVRERIVDIDEEMRRVPIRSSTACSNTIRHRCRSFPKTPGAAGSCGSATFFRTSGCSWWHRSSRQARARWFATSRQIRMPTVAALLRADRGGGTCATTTKDGSAGRIRTYDQPVNSRWLYH